MLSVPGVCRVKPAWRIKVPLRFCPAGGSEDHAVEGGLELLVDRSTPVARIVPYEGEGDLLLVRHPRGTYKTLGDVPIPPPVALDGDVVDLLLEERQGR